MQTSVYKHERTGLLVRLYINQCEYDRAAVLLDSVDWSVSLSPYERTILLLKNKRWRTLCEVTDDDLLKGIACYNLHDYARAVDFLSEPVAPHDYRKIYLTRAYMEQAEYARALQTLFSVDSIASYLYPEYQDMLFALFSYYDDYTVILNELQKLKKPHVREYVRLQVYEKLKDTTNIDRSAWNLIRHYPKSDGAYYACRFVTAKNKTDSKAIGKVYYYHGEYDSAFRHFKKATHDDAVNYYIGMIHYRWKNYTTAATYFSRSTWSAAYYYRGRAYETMGNHERAIAIYDSLSALRKNSKYATRGLKRKAFLLEDVGDTLRAVETFLRINNQDAKFRAAMQLLRLEKYNEAEQIFRVSNDPEFIYWRARATERSGGSAESLMTYLTNTYPLSYYTIVQSKNAVVFDTMTLDTWIAQFGDSAATFSASDSTHLRNAVRYFSINETEYALAELALIDDKNAHDLLFLSQLCAQYGANKQSILYSLQVKNSAEKNGVHTTPRALFDLLYPTRYLFRIIDLNTDTSLCLAMIWQESLFDPDAQSHADARGLMQIIPSTGAKIAHDLNVSSYSLYDPSTSIRFGTYYFQNLYKDFESVPLSLAGYNAGPVRVKQWVTKRAPRGMDEFIDLIPYDETRYYVKSVLSLRVIYETLLEM
jgi:soluble lytic murein transglycosylase-like protein